MKITNLVLLSSCLLFSLLTGTTKSFATLPSELSSSRSQHFFNHNPDNSYIDPYRNFQRPGDNLEAVMIQAVEKAKTSIDLAVYELNLPLLAKALVRAHKKGVKVRVIVNDHADQAFKVLTDAEYEKLSDHDRKKYDDLFFFIDENRNLKIEEQELLDRDVFTLFNKASMKWRSDRNTSGRIRHPLMHHKFIIIDSKHLVIGTANFTHSGIHGDTSSVEEVLSKRSLGNANSLTWLPEVSEVAKSFEEEFELMWAGKFGVKKKARGLKTWQTAHGKISVQFAPINRRVKNIKTTIENLSDWLLQVQSQVDVGLFVWSDQQSLNALRQRKRIQQNNGIDLKIRVMIDPSFMFRWYSEALDMWGLEMLSERCSIEENNIPWTREEQQSVSLAIPQLHKGDKFHYKFAVLDQEAVVLGSHNWSVAGERVNDELIVKIENSQAAEEYTKQYNYHWPKTFYPATMPPSWLFQKIQQRTIDCANNTGAQEQGL